MDLVRGAVSATLAPARGGRLARLTVAGRDVVAPMDGWGPDPRIWPKTGAYPLVPYSNRIRDGLLRFRDRSYRLTPHPDAAPSTLHGTGHLRPWATEAAREGAASLVLRHEPDEHWPWAFEARQDFTLTGDGIAVDIALRNTGTEAFPAGIGWHPFVPAGPDATVTVDAGTAWVLDASGLPTGASGPAPAGPSPASAHLSVWRRARLAEPDGWTVTLTADPNFLHFIVWRPPGGRYACLEPVSHLADGFNLAALGLAAPEAAGLVVLEPGATLRGTVTLAAGPAER
ncbi:aldose epimerase family protein [Prosthecomicrobium sp. N25]|uniref:aldose epimerase family protein n=1 Tax=Prosthecomicrobium sp. N25 TaxID=3129254 RepID=UPI0030779A45